MSQRSMQSPEKSVINFCYNPQMIQFKYIYGWDSQYKPKVIAIMICNLNKSEWMS